MKSHLDFFEPKRPRRNAAGAESNHYADFALDEKGLHPHVDGIRTAV
jgi:hypothetical protein